MKVVFKLFTILFFVFLFAFLLGGVLIVGTQLFGVFTLNGNVVTGVNERISSIVFSCATLCALCAFILQYQPEARAERQKAEVAQKLTEETENHDN